MTCRTFTRQTQKTADGRIIVDRLNQMEEEEYHDYGNCPNHLMERVLSATRPGWMDVSCACGMRITIAPHVEAYLDQLDREEDGFMRPATEENPSVICLWPEPRDDYADDIKTAIACAGCGTPGYFYFCQPGLDSIPHPLKFECSDCGRKKVEELRARGLCPCCGLSPCAEDCELQEIAPRD